MKKHVLVAISILFLLALASPAFAYSTDFESFAIGTPAASLTVPGIAFSGTGWKIYGGYSTVPYVVGNGLGSYGGNLTMSFATRQSSVSFSYVTCVPFTARAYNGLTVVDSASAGGACGVGGRISLGSTAITSVILAFSGAANTGIDNVNTTAVGEARACDVNDGRVNHAPDKDCAAPVAIYCTADGIDIYRVDPTTADGSLALRVTNADIDTVGVPSDGNALVASEGNIVLSRLTTGEFQVNTAYWDGKPYIVAWDDCPASNAYDLAS